MDLNHIRASSQNLKVNGGPPDIAKTKASIEKLSSMTFKNRSLNCFKSIFFNEYHEVRIRTDVEDIKGRMSLADIYSI